MSLDKIAQKFGVTTQGNANSNPNLDTIAEKFLKPPPMSEEPSDNFAIPQSDLPYGAKGITKAGLPYYGEAFHGWVRKTYGDLFDPAKRLVDPNEAEWNKYQGVANKMAQTADRTFNWDAWGEGIFGLSSKEVGNAVAALTVPGEVSRARNQAKVDAGEMTKTGAALNSFGEGVASTANIMKDVVQRGLWGALEIVGLTDTAARKVWALRMGIDTISDKYGKVDSGFWSNAYTGNFVRDIGTVIGAVQSGKISQDEVLSTINDTMGGSQAVYTMMVNPDEAANILTAGKVAKESLFNIGRFVTGKEIVGVDLQSSHTAYSMAFDSHLQETFNQRVANGEEPGFVAADLGHPGIELAGSIFGDPATYLGMGLVKPSFVGTRMKFLGKEIDIFGYMPRVPWESAGRIPSFGELLHLNVGNVRLKNAGDAMYFKYADPEIEKAGRAAFEGVQDAESIANLKKAINNSVKRVQAPIDDLKPLTQMDGVIDPAAKAKQAAALKRTYSFTAGTATTRARTTAKTMENVFDMIHSSSANISETMDTLMDMVRRNNGDELAAQRLWLKGGIGPDGITKGHGALLQSEAALLTGDMLNRIGPDQIQKIMTISAGDANKFGSNIYHELDKALQGVFPTTQEMAEAKKLVKGGDTSLKNIELAQRFDDLPAHIKTISAIQAKTQKAQGFIVGGQVNLYMKWSPGYAARNVMSQGLTVASEMGLSKAIGTTVDAFVKSVGGVFAETFKLGDTKLDPFAKHIAMRAEQSIDLVGAIPHAIATSFGIAGVENAKGFNALNLAQKTEMLTAADIVHGTMVEEIKKALPAVMSGETSIQTALIDTGALTEKQGKLLVKYINDFSGNTEKAIMKLKKSISGNKVESWRHVPLPENMNQYLRQTGNYDEVARLQENALSQTEFVEGVNGIMKRIYDTAKKAVSQEVPSISGTVPEELRSTVDDLIDNFKLGMSDEMEADVFTRRVQAWQNVRDNLEGVKNRLISEFTKQMPNVNAKKYTDELTATNARWNQNYRAIDGVRTMTRKVIEGIREGSMTPEQGWNSLQHGIGYDIKNLFPDIDPKTTPTKDVIDRIWAGYFDFSAEHWRNVNNDLYNDSMTTFQKWSTEGGANFDDIAGIHNKADDPFLLLQKAKKEAMDLEAMSGRPSLEKFKKVPEGTTLSQMTQTSEFVDANGKAFNKKAIFNKVNAERKAMGLRPYVTYGDVPFQEAQNVMKSRMSNLASPAEVVKKTNAMLAKGEKVKPSNLANIAETPLDELPAPVMEKIKILAKNILSDISGVEKTGDARNTIKRIGGINAKEFSDIMGGKIGIDKAGVSPGMFSSSGNGLDNVAIALREDGFITVDQAGDLNYVRDYIRNIVKTKTSSPIKSLEKIAAGLDAKTASVRNAKEMIFDRLRYGDRMTGTPPDMLALRELGADKKVMQEALDDFNDITGNKFTIDEAIDASTPAEAAMRNADRPFYDEAGKLTQPKRYAMAQDIPEDLMRSAVEAQRLPPPFNPDYITPARGHFMAQEDFVAEASKWRDEVSQSWGKFDDIDELPDNIEEGLSAWKGKFDDRMRIVKDKAMVYAGARRDFLLHDYNKTYGDLALGYLMPFQYWSSRTYKQWAEKLVENPKFASAYLAYKQFNEKEHADSPAWWRQNVGINLPGVNNGNPVMFNLEAAFNPLNSLTGVDFNDPYKRVDWLSRTVDDLGKMGPAVSTPINWGVALWLYAKGEDEAAKRWAGRFAPATSAIKAGLTKAGLDLNAGPLIKHNELDPFVNLLNDGLDPYELNRVNRALSNLVEAEKDPEKQALLATQAADAARTHDGPMWEQARYEAVNNRSTSTLTSFFLGAGFKARTEEDMKVDQFYGEYHKLLASRDNMPADEYREAWDNLRDEYKFADALIIGKKADPERESAYAYNVLGRIPPGQMSGLLEQVGLNNNEINNFYNTKGDFDKWSEGDQKRFMAAVVDLGAILQMPPKPTKQEWNKAKDGYGDLKDNVAKQLGDPEIWDKVNQYYALKGEARYKGNDYLDKHPEVGRALDMQTQMLTASPVVFKYYGSLDTIQSYYAGNQRKFLEKKYGAGVYDMYYQYLDSVDKNEKKVLGKKLKKFMKEKSAMKDSMNRAIVDMALRLPNQPEVTYRADLTNPTGAQVDLINTLNAPSYVDPQTLIQNSSPAMQELVQMYWLNGTKLPYAATQQLDYLGGQFGISGDEALQIMGIALQQP